MLSHERDQERKGQLEAELWAIKLVLERKTSAALELDQTRVGRLSRMDAMQQQAMDSGLRERLHVKARRLEAALLRLEEGSYGICCKCGETIATERMCADIAAPFCATCQEDIDEKRQTT